MTETTHNGGHAHDWAAIERMPEFQALTRSRRRFAWVAGGAGVGLGALYVLLTAIAHGLMGTKLIGSFSLGFAGGVALVVMTWAITFAYMRRSERVWAPLEARIRMQVLGPVAPVSADEPSELVLAGEVW
jgi:uncharacterized membrane protein (DUF485 family)